MKQKVINWLKRVRDIIRCCKSTNEVYINKYLDLLKKQNNNNPTSDKVDL